MMMKTSWVTEEKLPFIYSRKLAWIYWSIFHGHPCYFSLQKPDQLNTIFFPNEELLELRKQIALHLLKNTDMNVVNISWPFFLFQFAENMINQTSLFFPNDDKDILSHRRKIALHLIRKTGMNIANISSPFLFQFPELLINQTPLFYRW